GPCTDPPGAVLPLSRFGIARVVRSGLPVAKPLAGNEGEIRTPRGNQPAAFRGSITMTTVASQNEKLKVPLAMKLLARALDPAALDGEAKTSATMFVRVCRREGIGLPELVTALALVRYVERDDPDPEPAA